MPTCTNRRSPAVMSIRVALIARVRMAAIIGSAILSLIRSKDARPEALLTLANLLRRMDACSAGGSHAR